ncbi:MAG: hypothetical protein ABSA82_00640 [Thermacetogeniaceae bacterium]|jgi:hypothetical protein
MLERVIGTIGMIFIFLIVLMGAAMFMGVMGQWYKVQDQAQFLAVSIGDSGYESSTIQAEFDGWNAEYCRDEATINQAESNFTGYTQSNPAPWGSPITVEVDDNVQISLLGFPSTLPSPIKGIGKSLSSFL